MHLIVGLGNPGEKYDNTRHNIGFTTLDHLLKKFEPLSNSSWDKSTKTKSLVKKLTIKDYPVLFAKPQTYMNNSGLAVNLLLQFYKIEPKDLIIIHDELDLPLGKIQIKFGGGTAGHNGIESILNTIGTDKFIRIRMGISHPHKNTKPLSKIKDDHTVKDYVVSHFVDGEQKDARTMIKHVERDLPLLLKHGLEKFMSSYNSSLK